MNEVNMIVRKKTRGFICTTAHPDGCAENVREQIGYVKKQGPIKGSKKVLVIGASTGYGLASRIVQAFGAGASTLGVFFERPAHGSRTATAGWYNSVAFERQAEKEGLYSKSLNGDAFSNEMKAKVIETIKEDLGKIDLVVYSLASPKRLNPDTGIMSNSVLKPIDGLYTNKTVDFHTGHISTVSIEPASDEEITSTVEVMGGQDWYLWMKALKEADVLEEGVQTVAYSYIGPELTYPVYREGTIGKAKNHLEATASDISDLLKDLSGQGLVSVNKALVTQSSSAIPVVPLYISILYKVMKEKGIHENCVEQCYRLFDAFMYKDKTPLDSEGRVRIDDLEMLEDVQEAVYETWKQVTSENLDDLSDIEGYREEFYQLFGFNKKQINYEQDVDVDLNHIHIKSI